jgi:hypothetical protein
VLAEAVVVRQVEAGTVRSVTALAVKMAKLAAQGQIQAQTLRKSPSDVDAVWARRGEAVGKYLIHPKHGRHEVLAGARAWLREDGQAVSGASGLRLWERVEAGEFELRRD